MTTGIAWTENGITRIVNADELDALREAVEVLEDRLAVATRDYESEQWLDARNRERWFALARKFDEFREATYEAVEVLENMPDADDDYEGWKTAAKDYYAQTIALKAKIRDLNASLPHTYSSSLYLREQADHAKTKGALREAEAKIKELHEAIDLILSHATIRQLAKEGVAFGDLSHEKDPEFWIRWANER